MRLFANTYLPGKAKAGGFAGLLHLRRRIYDGSSFPRICASARTLGLLCAPSVGPGLRRAFGRPVTRAAEPDERAAYDSMWRNAIRAAADVVTITSYNEWHEGTQIEPAPAVGARTSPTTAPTVSRARRRSAPISTARRCGRPGTATGFTPPP